MDRKKEERGSVLVLHERRKHKGKRATEHKKRDRLIALEKYVGKHRQRERERVRWKIE